MKDWIVELGPDDLRKCQAWGAERNRQSSCFEHAHGFDGDGEIAHTDGVISECAFGIAFKDIRGISLEWTPVQPNFWDLKADIGGKYQLRSTRLAWGNLILHPDPKDNVEQVFVLARLAGLPRVELVGWIYGRDGKKPEFWRTKLRSPCFIYTGRLNCMGEIPNP